MLLCSHSLFVSAQVSIGNVEEPALGALLQLKNIDGATGGAVNATKGLGMPRVNLSDAKSLAPLIASATDEEKQNVVGMVVYASSDFGRVPTYCEGMYVWDGDKWQPWLEGQEVSNGMTTGLSYTTDIEGNKYYYKQFGNTYWMISNLRTTKRADGTSIATAALPLYMNNGKRSGELVGDLETEPVTVMQKSDLEDVSKKVTFKENSISVTYTYAQFANIFGLLYTADQIEGICPDGWRLPKQEDMRALGQYLGSEYIEGIYPGGVGTANKGYLKNVQKFKANDWDYTPGDRSTVYSWGGFSLCSVQNSGIHFVPTGYVRISPDGIPDARQFGRETFMHFSDITANPNNHSYMVLNAEEDYIVFREAGISANHSLPVRCVKDAR